MLGLGKVPRARRAALEAEGLVACEEGCPLSLRYRKYRSPHFRLTGHKGGFGWVVLTERTLAVKAHWEVAEIPLAAITDANLQYGTIGPGCFFVRYDAADFYSDRSGTVEHRVYTSNAGKLVDAIDAQVGRGTPNVARQDVFPSAQDRWATIMVWSMALAIWIGTVGVALTMPTSGEALVAWIIGGLSGALGLWFWATTRYRITDTDLHMHSGPIHMRVALSKIRSVHACGGVESTFRGYAMGWSLHVLLVERSDKSFGYRISPRDRAGFMQCLARRVPDLVLDGTVSASTPAARQASAFRRSEGEPDPSRPSGRRDSRRPPSEV